MWADVARGETSPLLKIKNTLSIAQYYN